jgi:hypothetical protein
MEDIYSLDNLFNELIFTVSSNSWLIYLSIFTLDIISKQFFLNLIFFSRR